MHRVAMLCTTSEPLSRTVSLVYYSFRSERNADPLALANWMPGEIPHTLRPCLKANQGAIKLTLQRVRFERSGSNYIIRRKNPDHDISTVPPEHYR